MDENLGSNFVRVNRLFVLIYTNQDHNAKRYKGKRYYLPKGIIKSHNVIISGDNFYDQKLSSDVKRSEEIGNLTTGQSEYYTTECFLDYDYIKNHYILIAVDLSRQKKLDADPKVIQQIEFVGKFENNDGVLTVLEKVKRHINILSRKCHCLIKDGKF